ncbi:HNH endonuclease [Microbacterium lacus]|uniref:HNH endonuclease n=1 Tax=Microbacterium lacus TaxID=415217 RepID=UPI00384C3EA7
MPTTLDAIAETVERVRAIWPGESVESLTREQMIAVNDELGRLRRLVDAGHAQVASRIARESRPELGPDSLAKEQGFRNPTALIAATGGTTTGEAARLVRVGEATEPRMTLTGEVAPARHPHVASAIASGSIGTAAASAIIAMLDRMAFRAGREATDAAEHRLCEQAPGLTLDQLNRVILQAEAVLDPAGVEPREDELRHEKALRFHHEASGAIVLTARFDPEGGAPVKAAIEAYVRQALAAAHDNPDPDASRPTIPQLQADALTRIAEHLLGCEHRDLPVEGATVVVRVSLDDLRDGTGHATIDGMDAPISISTARRMAAGVVIPCVLGNNSEILDWGRAKRLFTPAQRLALVERDQGCAKCGAPPSHTKVHHIRWWARDAGPTDLSNGILLCESCHHHIHDNGWEIRIDGIGVDAHVWFIPPIHVDPDRTPRLGGRRRYGFAA